MESTRVCNKLLITAIPREMKPLQIAFVHSPSLFYKKKLEALLGFVKGLFNKERAMYTATK